MKKIIFEDDSQIAVQKITLSANMNTKKNQILRGASAPMTFAGYPTEAKLAERSQSHDMPLLLKSTTSVFGDHWTE